MSTELFPRVDDAFFDEYYHPLLSKPVATGLRLILDVDLAREFLHAGLLHFRTGEPTTYVWPGAIPRGGFGVYVED